LELVGLQLQVLQLAAQHHDGAVAAVVAGVGELEAVAAPQAQAPLVVEFEVEAGAPFAGREVRELGLPSGCILVRCFDDGRESIPTAGTRLNAHMRITAVISPEAIASLELLRQGCAAKQH